MAMLQANYVRHGEKGTQRKSHLDGDRTESSDSINLRNVGCARESSNVSSGGITNPPTPLLDADDVAAVLSHPNKNL